MSREQATATEALLAHASGDRLAASRLLPLVYDKLRSLATHYMRRERANHTLQPTALVHEAYLRLIDSSQVDWQGKTHFLAVAATQMRRVLTDHARAHLSRKRGGGVRLLSLDENVAGCGSDAVDVVALDEALEKLARNSPRQSRVVELRYFGGLSVDEVARILGVSPGTVKGDWRVAKAWLARELGSKEREER